MSPSYMRAAFFILRPGNLKEVKTAAYELFNPVLYEKAQYMIFARNVFLFSTFFSPTATVHSIKKYQIYSEEKDKYKRYACIAVGVLSTGLFVLSCRRMHSWTKYIQEGMKKGYLQ